VQFAVRQLVQFTRVSLRAHQSKSVTMHVALRQMQYWDATSQKWLPATGSRTVYVGAADALKAPVGDPGASTSLSEHATIHVLGAGTGTGKTVAYDVNDSFMSPGKSGTLTGTAESCQDEQLSATVVSGNLVVPRGQWCDIIDTTIKGNLIISQSGGVRIEDSSVGGSLVATDNKVAADPLSSNTDVLCNTTVAGDVEITGSGNSVPWNLGLCGGNTVHGSVVFTDNAATGNSITGNTVSGKLTCGSDGSIATSGNTVDGVSQMGCKPERRSGPGSHRGGNPGRSHGRANPRGHGNSWGHTSHRNHH
jgi:hypothetical protein